MVTDHASILPGTPDNGLLDSVEAMWEAVNPNCVVQCVCRVILGLLGAGTRKPVVVSYLSVGMGAWP